MPKKITENQFKKKLNELSSEEKDSLLLLLFKSGKTIQTSLTFYFDGKSYRDNVVGEYKKKITKAFNPSERKLLTTGVDISHVKSVINKAEAVIFTENEVLSSYYKAQLYLHCTYEATTFLELYGGGPDEIYDFADSYYMKTCGFISSYIGRDVGEGRGLAGDEDLAWDFYIDNRETLREIINSAGSVGEGLADSMQSSFDMAESCVKTVYKEV